MQVLPSDLQQNNKKLTNLITKHHKLKEVAIYTEIFFEHYRSRRACLNILVSE